MAIFEESIPVILEHEGSKFTNIAGDPGGATKWGITLRSAQNDLQDLDLNHDGRVDVDELKGLTQEQATTYYRREWWLPGYGMLSSQLVATKLLDSAVNVGAKPAHQYLQNALKKLNYPVVPDGAIGPQTIAYANQAAKEVGEETLVDSMGDFQADHYRQWVGAKPQERQKFLNGLLARAAWPKIYKGES